jgi:hypothetical protein
MFVVALNTNDHTTYDSINLNTIHDFWMRIVHQTYERIILENMYMGHDSTLKN